MDQRNLSNIITERSWESRRKLKRFLGNKLVAMPCACNNLHHSSSGNLITEFFFKATIQNNQVIWIIWCYYKRLLFTVLTNIHLYAYLQLVLWSYFHNTFEYILKSWMSLQSEPMPHKENHSTYLHMKSTLLLFRLRDYTRNYRKAFLIYSWN